MPDFSYKARRETGEDVLGSVVAASKRDAVRLLTEQSLYPLEVIDTQPAKRAIRHNKKVKTRDLASTLVQLADLLQSGVPLLRSLKVLADQASNSTLESVLSEVHDLVAEGTPLDEALVRYPRVFDELTISMVRAGSEGGFLEDALKRTADFLEAQDELKSRVMGAMTYPAILAGAGTTVTVVLLVFFVPKFAELFARLEEQGGLPTATVWLLWISDTLGSPWVLLIVAACIGLGAWIRIFASTTRGRLKIDGWKLKIPLIGQIFLGFSLSRFCRVLGTLLRNGVPLIRSLQISSESAGNRVLGQAVLHSAENISSGETLSAPLAQCGLIPRPVMAMISVAEESNNLDNVLINIADGIDRRMNRQLDLMVRLVEPLMLLLMGLIILFVMVALLLPVFEMSANVG